MRISEIVTTPLWIPYKQPYHFAQGVIHGAGVILVEVHTDEGVTGYGESIGTPSAEGIRAYLARAADLCIGRSPFENARLMGEAYHALFELQGTCSAPEVCGPGTGRARDGAVGRHGQGVQGAPSMNCWAAPFATRCATSGSPRAQPRRTWPPRPGGSRPRAAR